MAFAVWYHMCQSVKSTEASVTVQVYFFRSNYEKSAITALHLRLPPALKTAASLIIGYMETKK